MVYMLNTFFSPSRAHPSLLPAALSVTHAYFIWQVLDIDSKHYVITTATKKTNKLYWHLLIQYLAHT